MTPQLRFPEFTDEWQVKKLGEVVEYTKGFAFKSKDYEYKGVRIVRVSDLGSSYIKQSSTKTYISEENARNYSRYELKRGNIIITTVGSRPEMRESAVGRGIYVGNENEGLLNQNLLKIESTNKVNNRFIFSFINSERYIEYIKSVKRGNANQANITVKDLMGYRVSLPSEPEQQKIAELLTAIDDKIAAQEQKVEKLEAYKRGMMQKIFSQQIRFTRGDGSQYPGWEAKKLGYLTDIAKSGGTPTATNRSYYTNGDIPFLAISDITEQGKYLSYTSKSINKNGLRNSSSWLVPTNSIIYSMYASVGLPIINKVPVATSQAVMNLVLKQDVSVEYIYYFLLDYRRRIHRYIETGTQGNLNAQIVKDIQVDLPGPREQQKIADYLSALDQKITLTRDKLEKTKQFKKGLLQRMFT